MTLVEVVTGAAISSGVLFVGVSCFVASMNSWIRGQGYINADTSANESLRSVSSELKEAMNVTVNATGTSISYTKPMTDSTGSYVMPVQSDGVSRQITLTNGNLVLTRGSSSFTLCSGVSSTDPNTGATYRVFTAGGGQITRQVTIMIVAQRSSYRDAPVVSRARQTMFLRNVPEITR